MTDLSAERMVTHELCERRQAWTEQYHLPRISIVAAMYRSLDAGLRTESDPEKAAQDEFLALAANPGLDVQGAVNLYATAMHHARLCAVVVSALRSAFPAPWTMVDPVALPDGSTWHSGLYNAGNGHPRRVALVDRWTDDRKQQEISGWRTVGETCALNTTILVTAVTIGPSQGMRRHSAWTRCYRHPRNRTFRFMRKGTDEDFSKTWTRVWREDAGITTKLWLDKMKEDGCMEDLVHTLQVPPPQYREAYLAEMTRMSAEMAASGPTPPMRLSGCYGWAPCPFLNICPATDPSKFGFRLRQKTPRMDSNNL